MEERPSTSQVWETCAGLREGVRKLMNDIMKYGRKVEPAGGRTGADDADLADLKG